MLYVLLALAIVALIGSLVFYAYLDLQLTTNAVEEEEE